MRLRLYTGSRLSAGSRPYKLFYQALKAGTVIRIWFWLKPRLWGLLFLILSIAAILIAHGEYLSYVDRTGNSANVGRSYLFKWLGLLFVVFAYGIINWLSIKRALKRRAKAIERDERVGDGFDFLRKKRNLEHKKN